MKKLYKILFIGGGGQFSGGQISGGQFSWEDYFRGALFPGEFFLRAFFPGAFFLAPCQAYMMDLFWQKKFCENYLND